MRDELSLPPLVLIEQHGGNWANFTPYCDALYAIFVADFVKSTPTFQGVPVKYHGKIIEGKISAFWHVISAGKIEEDRTPDERRCERIAWPKQLIALAEAGKIPWWENNHNKDNRIVIALPDYSYVVILARRNGYYLLYTAYHVERKHQQDKFRKEHQAYLTAHKGGGQSTPQ